jgi:hypothetical protein
VKTNLRKRNGVALWRDAENAESRFIPKLASASLQGLKIQWNQLRILFRSVVFLLSSTSLSTIENGKTTRYLLFTDSATIAEACKTD